MAIQWVHDNIVAFGGDPSRVTLFGQSAGAASVIFQALYPGNAGLINAVIAESGSANGVWAIDNDPNQGFNRLLNKTGCAQNRDYDIAVQCLRSISVRTLQRYIDPHKFYLPVIDGEFVMESVIQLFNNRKNTSPSLRLYGDIDVIIGINNYDGASMWGCTLNQTDDKGISEVEFEHFYKKDILSHFQINNYDLTYKAIRQQYTDWANPNNKTIIRDMLIDLATDAIFAEPAVTAAHAHTLMNGTGKTYLYEFRHRSSYSKAVDWLHGACHTDEVPYVFGFFKDFMEAFVGMNYSDPVLYIPQEEVELSTIMMKYWSNFAKTGSPNDPHDKALPQWPLFDEDNQEYIVLQTNMTSYPAKERMRSSAVNFWKDLVPAIQNVPTDKPCDINTVSSATRTCITLLCIAHSVLLNTINMLVTQ